MRGFQEGEKVTIVNGGANDARVLAVTTVAQRNRDGGCKTADGTRWTKWDREFGGWRFLRAHKDGDEAEAALAPMLHRLDDAKSAESQARSQADYASDKIKGLLAEVERERARQAQHLVEADRHKAEIKSIEAEIKAARQAKSAEAPS